MAIAWASIKPLIKKQVADLTGVAADNVRYVDEPSGALFGVVPVIWLRVSSIVGLGQDEERYEAPPETEPLDDRGVTVVGQRVFTLSVRCESFTQDLTDPRHPVNVLELLKTRFWRASSAAERFGIFDVADYLATNWFNYVDARRPIAVCVTDFKCVTNNVDVDDTVGAGDWIGEAEINSVPINDVDGSPTQSQVVLDVIAD